MKQYIVITADTNDADYVTSKTEITHEQIEKIKPIVQAIKDFSPYRGTSPSWKHLFCHNYPAGACHRSDLGEKSAEEMYGHIPWFNLFKEFIPYDDYGIHTIKTIEIVGEGEKLL